jgi:hypothetical protein
LEQLTLYCNDHAVIKPLPGLPQASALQLGTFSTGVGLPGLHPRAQAEVERALAATHNFALVTELARVARADSLWDAFRVELLRSAALQNLDLRRWEVLAGAITGSSDGRRCTHCGKAWPDRLLYAGLLNMCTAAARHVISPAIWLSRWNKWAMDARRSGVNLSRNVVPPEGAPMNSTAPSIKTPPSPLL